MIYILRLHIFDWMQSWLNRSEQNLIYPASLWQFTIRAVSLAWMSTNSHSHSTRSIDWDVLFPLAAYFRETPTEIWYNCIYIIYHYMLNIFYMTISHVIRWWTSNSQKQRFTKRAEKTRTKFDPLVSCFSYGFLFALFLHFFLWFVFPAFFLFLFPIIFWWCTFFLVKQFKIEEHLEKGGNTIVKKKVKIDKYRGKHPKQKRTIRVCLFLVHTFSAFGESVLFPFFHFSIFIIFAFSKPKLVTGTLNDMYVDRHKQMHIPKLTLNQPFTKHFPSHFLNIFHLCHLGKSWATRVPCVARPAGLPRKMADQCGGSSGAWLRFCLLANCHDWMRFVGCTLW